jgi:hypothetical protein
MFQVNKEWLKRDVIHQHVFCLHNIKWSGEDIKNRRQKNKAVLDANKKVTIEVNERKTTCDSSQSYWEITLHVGS